jgi:ATP-dependent helicase HepA
LGGGEEILGEITREIRNIAENYSLNDEERKSKLQQLADNKIRFIQEQEELEQRQVELFGIRLPEDQMKKEIEEASSFWLSPVSIRRLVTLYLQRTCGKEQDFILGEKLLKTLRLSQDARNSLLRDFQQLPRQNTTAYREWENWLKGANPHLLVTFESDCATKHPEAAFIMPLHPLVKQAAMSLDTRQRVITTLKTRANEVPPGRYEFAIYQWRFHGIREDLVLRPIAASEAVTAHLGRLLEKAADATIDDPGDGGSPAWDELDAQHYKLWSEARAKHRQRTQKLAEYRRESLSTSHRARIALLEEQLKQASNEKIQKMRQSQIAAAEADYARRVQDLDIAMERADVIAGPVAYGVLVVDGGQ